jgi:uncharacterized Zn finger protein (UPF0148 family)
MLPAVTLVCKQCKKVFDIELGKLFERAGKAACTICGKTSVYNFSDVKQFPPTF